jgi:4-diphosphocytidyl-2-C-methyl-D-erythritol kinase
MLSDIGSDFSRWQSAKVENFMVEHWRSLLNCIIVMKSVKLESPAKINLMLSVHGQRGDGFHALTSLVVSLVFGDILTTSLNEAGVDRLNCSDSAVPTGGANLIVKAAEAFREELGESVYFDFDLDKHIPMGAGLGGGSSNAAVALCAMNQLRGNCISKERLVAIAAELGSDCPFFIDSMPATMSGRGEVLEALPMGLAQALRGQKLVLFKPDFAINTAWAYSRLIESRPSAYESLELATHRLALFKGPENLEGLLYNSFESNLGRKYLAITCLLAQLRAAGFACLMSGSGSCCFALAQDASEVSKIRGICEAAWGSSIFFVETSIR